MRIFQIIIVFIVMMRNIDKKRSITKTMIISRIISWIIMGALAIFSAIILPYNYFTTSINLDDFNIIEKLHEEKGIYIYTILEEGEEEYLILKNEGVSNRLFLHCKAPMQELILINIDTFKYKHNIDIEDSIITHTYKKRWVDGVLSFWIILAFIIYLGSKQNKVSKVDKILVMLWLVITIGDTIFFIID